jgi:hypothetical protein
MPAILVHEHKFLHAPITTDTSYLTLGKTKKTLQMNQIQIPNHTRILLLKPIDNTLASRATHALLTPFQLNNYRTIQKLKILKDINNKIK